MNSEVKEDYPRMSMMPSLSLCTGKLQAEAGLPNISGAPAKRGTDIHRANELAFQGNVDEMQAWCDTLPEEQVEVSRWMVTFIRRWHIDNGDEVVTWLTEPEIEYPYIHGTTAEPMLVTGHIDLVAICDNGDVHIWDYKTGNTSYPEAGKNAQLLSYGAVYADTNDLDEVNIHLLSTGNTPRHSKHQMWDPDIKEGLASLVGVCAVATSPNPVRQPGGYQCQWCAARGTERCPESGAVTTKVGTPGSLSVRDTELSKRPKLVSTLKVAASVAKKGLDEAKALVTEDPDSIPGWGVSPNKVTPSIDPDQNQRAWELLDEAFEIMFPDFLACGTLSIPNLVTIVATMKGLPKPEARKKVLATLRPVLIDNIRRGSLKED